MDQAAFSESIARRFRMSSTRTIFAHTPSKDPIAISRIISPPTWTERGPPEDAFSIHMQTGPASRGELYVDGRPLGLTQQLPGSVRVLNMGNSPYAHIQEPVDFLRINITHRTLDDLAYDRGERRPGSLRQVVNQEDPVLHGLALALTARIDIYGPDDQLFIDHVGLALHKHIVKAYGNMRNPASWRGGLAHWQLRRACEMMITDMTGGVTISQLADACGLSASYFTSAFRTTTGVPPHRWLMNERIRRAKDLLRHKTLGISDVALACGFADQSHLTRVFLRMEGQPPGRWRRLLGE